jgi:hypothetical protein
MQNKKRLMFGSVVGITVLAALILLAGCPQPTNNNVEKYTISGTVKHDSDPLSGVAVKLLKDNEPLGDPVTTGDDGKYSFTGVTAGSGYTLTAELAEYKPYTSQVFEVDGNLLKPITLEKQPKYTVSGRVYLESADNPAAGATVQLLKDNAAVGSSVTTTATGGYTISDVPAGTGYTVTATLAEYNSGSTAAFEVSGNITGKDIILSQVTYSVSGIISLNYPVNGKAEGAAVQAKKAGVEIPGIAAAIVDANGAYTISGLAKGDGYTLTITLNGYGAIVTEPFEITDSSVTDKNATLVKTGYPVSGTVTAIPTADLTQVSLQVYRQSRTIGSPINPDVTGAFTFADVPVAATAVYTVKAVLSNYGTEETAAFAVTGPVTGLTLSLTIPLPSLLKAEAADALDAITLTFDKAVNITGTTGLTLTVAPPSTALTITSATPANAENKAWVLALSRSIASGETVTVEYDGAAGSAIKEAAGQQRDLPTFSNTVSMPGIKATEVKYRKSASRARVYVTFDRDWDSSAYTQIADGWTLRDSGNTTYQWLASNPLNYDSANSIVIELVNAGAPADHTGLTLTYSKAAAGTDKIVATDGTELEDFSMSAGAY